MLIASVLSICQIDLKKIIAYSSIMHMNFSVLGLLSGTNTGINGALYSMLSHGFISTGLFFLVGTLYKRYNTRLIFYYSGLVQILPLFSILSFLIFLSNSGFPLSSGFITEILIFYSLVKSDFIFEVNIIISAISTLLLVINFF